MYKTTKKKYERLAVSALAAGPKRSNSRKQLFNRLFEDGHFNGLIFLKMLMFELSIFINFLIMYTIFLIII